MASFRSCLLAVVTTLAALSFAAHADTINFNVSGGAGGFSGSGVLTTTLTAPGTYLITGISGGGSGGSVTGLIAPGGFGGNDNLLFPFNPQTLDTQGFSFSATDGTDTFDVNIFNKGTDYFAFFRDEDNFTATLPVSFTVSPSPSPVPEPSTFLLMSTGFLGVATLLRRKISV